ncbi:MAG: carbohydrate kinase, partial [Anaerolineae bacterium]|nr:carbohydrate kinase [Anaerolineae bacterium]
AGSLLAHRDTGEQQFVPAVPVENVVDQTGAGNTYCGALLAGIARGKSLREAGVMAAVSASFCVEQVGVMALDTITQDKRDQRYHQIF